MGFKKVNWALISSGNYFISSVTLFAANVHRVLEEIDTNTKSDGSSSLRQEKQDLTQKHQVSGTKLKC